MYPYSFTERALRGEDPAYCPTPVVDPQRRGMLRVLDMREADAERWRRLLYAELRSEAEEGSGRSRCASDLSTTCGTTISPKAGPRT
jgi:hypothetical protein